MSKKSKYVELLTQSKEDRAKALAPARAEQQEGNLSLAISTKKVELKELQTKLVEAKSAFPLEIDTILLAEADVALLERDIEVLEDIKAELFS